MTWEQTFAAAISFGRWAATDPAMAKATNREATRAVQEALRTAGWTVSALSHPSAPTIDLMVARDHADYWTNRRIVIRAECRALDLRTADLLPEKMPLWRWKWLP